MEIRSVSPSLTLAGFSSDPEDLISKNPRDHNINPVPEFVPVTICCPRYEDRSSIDVDLVAKSRNRHPPRLLRIKPKNFDRDRELNKRRIKINEEQEERRKKKKINEEEEEEHQKKKVEIKEEESEEDLVKRWNKHLQNLPPGCRFVRLLEPLPKKVVKEKEKSVWKTSIDEWTDEEVAATCPEVAMFKTMDMETAIKEVPILRQYRKQLKESQGFDIDVCPKIDICCGGVYPIKCSRELCTEEEYNSFMYYASLAIANYNKDNSDTEYKVIEVEKVNRSCCGVITYYITFSAEDHKAGVKTFRAKVLASDDEESQKVELCEPKS